MLISFQPCVTITVWQCPLADLLLCQEYFRKTEKRNPTETEIRVLDTYWSDHCRHTTFLTRIKEVSFGDDPVSVRIEQSFQEYLEIKKTVRSP